MGADHLVVKIEGITITYRTKDGKHVHIEHGSFDSSDNDTVMLGGMYSILRTNPFITLL